MAALRGVMESALLPAISSRHGLWAIGPTFAGSEIMRGDADLIAGGLLTELKTISKKPSLGVTDLWQILGYVLMDYVDEFAYGEEHEPGRIVPTLAAFGQRWRGLPAAGAMMDASTYRTLQAEGLPMTVVFEDARRVAVVKP